MHESNIITLKSVSVKNNIRFLKKKMNAKTKISSVVKSNAYGHGIEVIVPLLEGEGIDHFAVFDYKEALRVEKSLQKAQDIMIMGWIAQENIKNAIIKGFEMYVFNTERLKTIIQQAKNLNIKAKIHLEAETGMNRSGLNTEELQASVALILQNREHLTIKGFCTHLAGAESISNYLRIQKQLKKYNNLYSYLIANNIIPEYKHVANSAAAFVYPRSRMDLVRIGIMQYGFWSSTETFIHYTSNKKEKSDPLERILGWQSKIMSIKEVKAGEFIGYGISYLAQKNTRTALIPVGYSLGYNRSLSNKGRVLIRGHRCGVIGLVNMNMIIADITNIPEARQGDEVVIIGKQGQLEIQVSAFSDISNALNYEVLAHLPSGIKRIVI